LARAQTGEKHLIPKLDANRKDNFLKNFLKQVFLTKKTYCEKNIYEKNISKKKNIF